MPFSAPVQIENSKVAAEWSWLQSWEFGGSRTFYKSKLWKNGVTIKLWRKSLDRCAGDIAAEDLHKLFPGATLSAREAAAKAFNESYKYFKLDSCLRRAHFFAQIMQEAPDLSKPAENLNYDTENLKRKKDVKLANGKILPKGLFLRFREFPELADRYGKNGDISKDQIAIDNLAYTKREGNENIAIDAGYNFRGRPIIELTGSNNLDQIQKIIKSSADQIAIGNLAFANRKELGNGSIASGDGYNYRGRGLIQVTGKGSFEQVQHEINTQFPNSGINILIAPEKAARRKFTVKDKDGKLQNVDYYPVIDENNVVHQCIVFEEKEFQVIMEPRGAMISAMAYWSMKNLNSKAKGSTDKDVDSITAVVNFNTDEKSKQKRRDHFKIAREVFSD
jgi:predicted chitinase